MTKLSVLLTGATGYIAHQLLPVFRERYDLKLVDIKRERDGEAVEGVEVADLLHDDPGTLAPFFRVSMWSSIPAITAPAEPIPKPSTTASAATST